MKNASVVRKQVEDALHSRMLGALSPRIRPEVDRITSGNAALDGVLGGGLAVGALTEFVGRNGSGRTTAAQAYVAAATQDGKVCAWIDVADTFDPESAAACGVDLERLLWVRCETGVQSSASATTHTKPCLSQIAKGAIKKTLSKEEGRLHLRSEVKEIPQQICSLLHTEGEGYDRSIRHKKKNIGTPGAPNRRFYGDSSKREEQINSDRLPPRRGEYLGNNPRSAELLSLRIANALPSRRLDIKHASIGMTRNFAFPWKGLDQALRSTDLLLQGGGFSVIVIDLGSITPEIAWRTPLSTWFRFRSACERSRTSLLLLTQHPCARSSAESVVELQIGTMESEGMVMTGIRYRAVRARTHSNGGAVVPISRPPQLESVDQWVSSSLWARMI